MNKSVLKLKCFTILELVVAMVLTSIVVSIAYTGLRVTTTYITTSRKNASNTAEFTKFHNAIQLDFQKSNTIILLQEGVLCDSKDGHISYHFQESEIIRRWNEITADTFRFGTLDKRIEYDHALQESIGGLIDQVSLKLINQKDTLYFLVMKEYDAQFLVNHSFISEPWQE